MQTKIFSKRSVALSGLLGLLVTMAPTCGDITSPPGTTNSCQNTLDSDFPIGGTLSVGKPSKCPFKLTGSFPIPYVATVTVPSSSGVAYGFFQSQVTDRLGRTNAFVTNVVWSQGNGTYYVNISGDYYPAVGGFDANNNGYDNILNQLYRNSRWTSATATLAYSYGIPDASISGPTSGLGSGVEYNLTANTSDPEFVSPTTWTWKVNGSTVGTTNDNYFSWTTGAEGTTQNVEAIITDAYGRSHSASRTVITCTNHQFTC